MLAAAVAAAAAAPVQVSTLVADAVVPNLRMYPEVVIWRVLQRGP